MLELQKNKFWVYFVICCFVFSTMGFWQGPVMAAEAKEADLETSAVSAVVMDENGRVLYEKNPHQGLPPASVTKIMTLLVAIEAVEEGKIGLDDQITASENAWRQGGSQIWLEVGEVMTVREILTAVAVVSANDAAVAILEHIYGSEKEGVAAMNARAKSLGLLNTHFNNSNGLPGPEHYMSAYDAALIAKEAIEHPLYMELCSIKEHWLRGGKNWLVNTNKLLWWYAGADGLKTGWTEEAKYCFVGTAKKNDLRLISVVFGTTEPRSHLRESMRLLDWGYGNFVAENIVRKDAVAEKMRVNSGLSKEVNLIAAKDLNLTLQKGQTKKLDKRLITPESMSAPITAGQKYGELVVFKDGEEVAKVDLVAEQDVPKAGFFRIFFAMVADLLAMGRR
ncbi:MAG: D-alanyl-D-alanine carboxypeptidase [Sporomusaceae bacterium]|nr:D-alanyl-D-alanine carboxypeptidase [Sporomusaceae bacterium]